MQITDEELQRAMFEQLRRYPGQEKEVYEYFQKNPDAVASLRAPLYEEKVVDHLLAEVDVTDIEIADYHRRNPGRFAPRRSDRLTLDEAYLMIAEHLRAAARRRAFRQWLDARCAEVVELAPGYEHPGDPGQPDNTHRH